MSDVSTRWPEVFRPALRRRDQAWRLSAALLVSAVAWVALVEQQSVAERGLDVGLGVIAFALVLVRRRWPLTVAVGTTVLATFSSLAAGPSILAIVSLATGGVWVQIAVVGVLCVVSGEIHVGLNPTLQTDPRWLTLGAGIVATSATLAWGMYIGSRRALMWTLRHRVEAAEAERDLRAAQSRIEERGRIAREMHDVLAHRISQISVRAGALNYRTDLSRDEMRDSAGVIRESASEALTDLRGVLGVLRDAAGEPQHAPQPTYGDLAALVDEARGSGMRITYSDTVVDEPVPDVAGRTLYRIVQEGLTNAQRHAPSAGLEIDLGGTPQKGITAVLRNGLGFGRSSSPGSGLGLIGLTERAHLQGGRLQHGIQGRDFVLRVWIPWTS